MAPYRGTQNRPTGPPVGTVEVRLAAEFMERFGRAWSDGEIQLSWREICRWACIRDSPRRPAGGDLDAAIAWRWLADVAQVAKEHDDVMLPSRILGCARFWDWRARQYADVRDFAAVVQLPLAERDVMIRLAAIALPCLLALPEDLRVMQRQAGSYTVSGLAMCAVSRILEYHERRSLPSVPELDSVVTPELAALARDVWAGRVGHARWT